MKMKLFGLIKTKLFHFHRIFKNGRQGGGSSELPMDPPLNYYLIFQQMLHVKYQEISAQ